MTKKSYARQQRDLKKKEEDLLVKANKQLADNKLFDFLNQMEAEIRQELAKRANLLQVYSANKETLKRVEDPKRFGEVVQLITKDFENIIEKLNDVSSKHAGKTGSADIDSAIDAYGWVEKYHEIQTLLDTVIQVNLMYLNDAIAAASHKLYGDLSAITKENPELVRGAIEKVYAEGEKDGTIVVQDDPEEVAARDVNVITDVEVKEVV